MPGKNALRQQVKPLQAQQRDLPHHVDGYKGTCAQQQAEQQFARARLASRRVIVGGLAVLVVSVGKGEVDKRDLDGCIHEYIVKSGARRGVGDNLFLTSAAAYKKFLQMEEAHDAFPSADGKRGSTA
jgi:hypothetical protein